MPGRGGYSQGIRLLELAVVVILAGLLATAGIQRIMLLQREARVLMVENFAQSLKLAGRMVYLQSSAVGKLGERRYHLTAYGLGEGSEIEVQYGYPAITSTDNILRLFDDLSRRWHLNIDGEWLQASVDSRPDCLVRYQPPEQPGGQPRLEQRLEGC